MRSGPESFALCLVVLLVVFFIVFLLILVLFLIVLLLVLLWRTSLPTWRWRSRPLLGLIRRPLRRHQLSLFLWRSARPSLRRIVGWRSCLVRVPVWLYRNDVATILRRRRILRLRLIRPALRLIIRSILLQVRRRLHRSARWLYSGRDRLWSLLTIVIALRPVIRPILLQVRRRLHRPARWLHARRDRLRSLLMIVIVRRVRPILLPVVRRSRRLPVWLHRLLTRLPTVVIVCGWILVHLRIHRTLNSLSGVHRVSTRCSSLVAVIRRTGLLLLPAL